MSVTVRRNVLHICLVISFSFDYAFFFVYHVSFLLVLADVSLWQPLHFVTACRDGCLESEKEKEKSRYPHVARNR